MRVGTITAPSRWRDSTAIMGNASRRLRAPVESTRPAWISPRSRLARAVRSPLQILTPNVRLRGIVFTVNFLAVLGLWIVVSLSV